MLIRLTMLIFLILMSHKSFSTDIVKLQIQQLSKNKEAHNIEVIRRALEITEPEYSSFELKVIKKTMSGTRMRHSSLEGSVINTVIIPANERWDKQHIVIRIPVRLGLLNYRLLLVNKADLSKFEKVTTLTELKTFTAGLTHYWETTKILKSQGFKVIEIGQFNGLFLMLNKHRFNYLPRGIYEIYDELNARQNELQNVVVEPTLALNIPMLSYVYVSPSAPRIAKRLKSGLGKLLANGELKEILYKYYADDINRANLKKRKIIKIENNYYKKDIKDNEDYTEHLFFVN